MWFFKKREAEPNLLKEELARLDAVEKASDVREAMKGWRQHFDTLPPQLRSRVCWELARRGASRGRSGFHGMGGNKEMPFSFCGWADYRDPEWGETQGVGFRINRACFGDRPPVLYYLDDDNWPGEGREKKLDLIRRYSSGIVRVRTEQRVCKNWSGKEAECRVVLFELSRAAVKRTVMLEGKKCPTAQVGEYIFVLPRCGEFYCLLGEERDGELIPLHRDDYCMK